MQLVVKSVIPRKKHQQALHSPIKRSFAKNPIRWHKLVPLFLLSISFFSHNTIAQNLNSQFVNSSAIIQDNKGFIWLATANGLIRYDSENNITINSNNKNWPLPFNWINDIHLVDNDKLLLATETHKLWLFDTTNGTAEQLITEISNSSIYQVIAHRNKYYLYAPNKLYQVDPELNKTSLIADNIHLNHLQRTNKSVYISTFEGVFKVVDGHLIQVETGQISAMSSLGSTLVIAKNKELITISDEGIRHSIHIKTEIESLAHSNDALSVISIDIAGKVNQYTLADLQVVQHNYPAIEPIIIEKMFQDSTGVLWALSNRGVKRLTPSIATNFPKVFDVAINAIALTIHQDSLILGSYGGGIDLLLKDASFLPENINKQLTSGAKIITDLYSDDDDIYLATFDGLWRINTNNSAVSRIDFENNNQLLLNIKHKNGALYLTTDTNGVMKFNMATNSIDFHIPGDMLSSSEAIDVLPLANNKLWIATSAGIDIVDTKENTVRKVNSFGENKVISLLEYKNKVFVTTKGDGFFIFNFNGELLSHFAKNISFGYMSFINEEIWISARPGLYKLNPDTYQLKMIANTEQYTFTKKPVLLNDKVYVGHYGGVIEVPLILEETLHPKIYISKTIISGNAQLLSKRIQVESSNDVITLELASLDFRPGQEKQFKYQLNNGEWNDINGSQLTLTGLSSGDYHIEIMGTNSLGQWSDFKAFADISVAYPWYWHPNSRIIYAVLITFTLLLTIWLLYLRSRSISHIHKLFNEEMKTHGQSTSIIRRKLNKVQTLMSSQATVDDAKKDSKEQQKSEHTVEVQSLIGECLAELKTKYSHAEPSSLSGSSLTVALPYLADYFHQQYHVLVSVQLDNACEKIDYAIQTAIYRIIYEAILAAINNGNGGVFAVHINESNDKIWLRITDNEQSFAQFNSKINFDMAMYYIRQIANKFNATFHTYDNQEHGSEIIISIPLMKIS